MLIDSQGNKNTRPNETPISEATGTIATRSDEPDTANTGDRYAKKIIFSFFGTIAGIWILALILNYNGWVSTGFGLFFLLVITGTAIALTVPAIVLLTALTTHSKRATRKAAWSTYLVVMVIVSLLNLSTAIRADESEFNLG